MAPRPIEQILDQLASCYAEEAWCDFVEQHSAQIYQVICNYDADADKASTVVKI